MSHNTTLIVSGTHAAVSKLAEPILPLICDHTSGINAVNLMIPDAQGNDPLVQHAFSIIKKAMANDPGYAWTWQCNLAMLIQDAAGADKVTNQRANEYAAQFMKNAFEVDVTASDEYKTMATQWAAANNKVKMALCIATSDLPQFIEDERNTLPIPEAFWNLPLELADRRFCESDPTKQQLLPYIVAVNQHEKIFCYSRGNSGTEKRLVGNKSIGLGGHVDDVPQFDMSLYSWLQDEAEREVLEEVGLKPLAALEFVNLLVDRTNSVGRVHLGLLAIAHVDVPETGVAAEEGHIEKGEWLTVAELQELAKNGELENWSAMALEQLAD